MGEPGRVRGSEPVTLDQAASADALVEALDALIEKGVVLEGDVELGVADVALVRAGLRLYLSAVRSEPAPDRPGATPGAGPPRPSAPPDTSAGSGIDGKETSRSSDPSPSSPTSPAGPHPRRATTTPPPAERRGRDPARGLAHLVILLIDVVRRLMERQALRRVNEGSLSDERVEELGLTFAALEERMIELARQFDEPAAAEGSVQERTVMLGPDGGRPPSGI